MADRELADFHPSTGHLHTCMDRGDPEAGCDQDCAGHLYAIAQDAEQALSRVRTICDEWDVLSKGPSPSSTRLREALGTA